MNEVFGSLVGTQMRPIRMIVAQESGNARLGGKPPKGIRPFLITDLTCYFATLPLSDLLCVSIFLNIDYQNRNSPYYFFSHYYKLLTDHNNMIQFVLHQPVSPESESELVSAIPPLSLIQGTLAYDPEVKSIMDLRNNSIYNDHKTGGTPHFEQLEGSILQDSIDSLAQGYKHILQLCFPSKDDAKFNAQWPFGESVLHIFGKLDEEQNSWSFKYGWG